MLPESAAREIGLIFGLTEEAPAEEEASAEEAPAENAPADEEPVEDAPSDEELPLTSKFCNFFFIFKKAN